MGRSHVAPFVPGEGPRERHERRKDTNLTYVDELKRWCDTHGWQFEVKNDHHHWIFRKEGTKVEWWPSTAKLVKNQKWTKAYHCHDYLQLETFLLKADLMTRHKNP